MSVSAIQGVKVITCRGSHQRIGETIGEALREELQSKAANWRADEKTAWRAREYLAVVEQAAPELLDEIRGMERAAGVPEYYLLSGIVNPPARSNFQEGCSNIVFKQGPDGPLWGKNNDDDARPPGSTATVPARCILKIYPDNGIPLIIVAYCGSICGDMMNAEGVATGGSSGCGLFFQSPYHMPSSLWKRAGMHKARCTEEFARHITTLPLRGRGTLHVTVDREGNMFSTEIAPPLVQLRRPAPWMRGMNCTNWYQLPLLTPISGRNEADQANAKGRSATLEMALKEPELSLAYLQQVLRHHGEYDICRHGAERHDRGFTEWSIIGVPRQGKVLFCMGNPCQGHYDELEF